MTPETGGAFPRGLGRCAGLLFLRVALRRGAPIPSLSC